MKGIDETGYTYFEILETDKIKEKEMKGKFSKEYLWRLRLVLRSKLNGRNKIIAVNIGQSLYWDMVQEFWNGIQMN